MSMHLPSRRRQIGAKGRPMTLRRQTVGVLPAAYTDVVLLGVLRNYGPEQIVGGVQQGDAQVAILNDEIAAATWPGPPRARDFLVVDGRSWAIIGVYPVFEGTLLIGHKLWIRGGV